MRRDVLHGGTQKDLAETVLSMIAEDEKIRPQVRRFTNDRRAGVARTHQAAVQLQPESIPRHLRRSLDRFLAGPVEEVGISIQRQRRGNLNDVQGREFGPHALGQLAGQLHQIVNVFRIPYRNHHLRITHNLSLVQRAMDSRAKAYNKPAHEFLRAMGGTGFGRRRARIRLRGERGASLMTKFQRILCPVDFSDFSLNAYAYARSLAQHYKAHLSLLNVVQPLTVTYPYYYMPAQMTRLSSELVDKARRQLRELAEKYASDAVQPETVVEEGFIADVILGFAENQKADLIVMGTHGRRGLDRLVIGSVTERVLRKSPQPVLAVRKPAHDLVSPKEQQDSVSLRKVLLCTDFSDTAKKALGYALSLALEYKSELTLFHVIEHPGTSERLQAGATALAELKNSISAGNVEACGIRTLVRAGKPYEEIIRLALEDRTDLVVLGVRGRNVVDLALFGSTAHRILQLGPCPTLTVRI
jgi:nucleotide-binding universal stress UspA family protein